MGTFARTEFPVMLQITAELTRDARDLIGETSGIDLNLRSMLNSPDTLRAPNQAAVLKQPFDLWPVAFIDAREQNLSMSSFELITTPYSKPIAPYKAFLETMTEMKLSKEIYGRDVERKIAYLVAPPSGPIGMKLRRGQNETNVSLTGPGYWAIKDDGSMATASPELIARDFPTTPP
jgi:hypothetical protein